MWKKFALGVKLNTKNGIKESTDNRFLLHIYSVQIFLYTYFHFYLNTDTNNFVASTNTNIASLHIPTLLRDTRKFQT